MSIESEEINADLVRALRNKVNQLEARVDELENSTHSGGGQTTDSRDKAVIEQISPGERVRLGTLTKLFQSHTDIRNERTIKSRVRALVKRPEFVEVGMGVWEYRGDGE